MPQSVFNRYEKKYLMPERVYQELRGRLAPYMQVDFYGLHKNYLSRLFTSNRRDKILPQKTVFLLSEEKHLKSINKHMVDNSRRHDTH